MRFSAEFARTAFPFVHPYHLCSTSRGRFPWQAFPTNNKNRVLLLISDHVSSRLLIITYFSAHFSNRPSNVMLQTKPSFTVSRGSWGMRITGIFF